MFSPCLLAEQATAASAAATAAACSADKGKSLRASGRKWVSAERCEVKQCFYRQLSYRLPYIYFATAQKQMTQLCIIFSEEGDKFPLFMLTPLTSVITVEGSPKKVNMEKNLLDPDISPAAFLRS